MKKILLILFSFLILSNVLSQDSSLKIILSSSFISLNYKFSPIKDNLTQTITEHSYSNLHGFSHKLGLLKLQKINYGVFIDYTSLNYKLNYNFIAYQYDPFMLNYSHISIKYLGLGGLLGIFYNINRYFIGVNIIGKYCLLIDNTYKHFFSNGNYAKSNSIIYDQKIEKKIPIVESNTEFGIKIKKLDLSMCPTLFYTICKFSKTSVQKNNIQFAITLNVKYDV